MFANPVKGKNKIPQVSRRLYAGQVHALMRFHFQKADLFSQVTNINN